MQGKWNAGFRQYSEVKVSFIYKEMTEFDLTDSVPRRELHILSHSIAYSHIPAFFLGERPSYSPFDAGGPCVVVFDLDETFASFHLPNSTYVKQWRWRPSDLFTTDIMAHLKKALVLRSYLEYYEYVPLYFTKFIMITDFPYTNEPFLLSHFPILRDGCLTIRTCSQNNLQCILDFPNEPIPNSYILIPPYDHSFKVISSNPTDCYVKYVDLSYMTFDYRNNKFVYLTNTNVSTERNFIENPTVTIPFGKQHDKKNEAQDVKTLDFCKIDEEEKESLFSGFFASDFVEKVESKSMKSEICFPAPSINDLIGDLISNNEEKKVLSLVFKECDKFPPPDVPLNLLVSNFLSSFRFDFGFNVSQPPKGTKDFTEFSDFDYLHLGIPNLQVIQDSHIVEVKANEIIGKWDKQIFRPISGPKNAHYVVFYESTFKEAEIRSFFNQFCYTYSASSFGYLKPYPKVKAFIASHYESMQDDVIRFFASNSEIEFQLETILTFIVGRPILSANFALRSVVNYVKPDIFLNAEAAAIKALAFVVYSRIRRFSPNPFGRVYLSQNEIAAVFFGFRYDPPFLLANNSEDMMMHICWDTKMNFTAWSDGSGTVMHVLPIENVQRLFGFIKETSYFFSGKTIQFTLSVLGEGINKDLLASINSNIEILKESNNSSGKKTNKITVFSIYPSSSIQSIFREDFNDDVVSFDDHEFNFQPDDNFAEPFLTCYVMSKTQLPYTISLYSPSADHKQTLFDFAQQMSHLSWLSVKPNMEKRTISYPPSMMAVLRKGNGPIDTISQYEFLPSLEIL